ncbi:MAG: DNA polymerase III subunit alpha [Flavobacteriales bacterium]|nr:DNA polymerase III subunit alpha [Flavobacteriales bacterium]
MYLILDTETTGLPINFSKPISDFENWSTARCVQIAWQFHDEYGVLIEAGNDIIKSTDFEIPLDSTEIHGISNAIAQDHGIPISEALHNLNKVLSKTIFLIGHNIDFDLNVLGSEYLRLDMVHPLFDLQTIDTMKKTVDYCQLKFGRDGIIKKIESNGQWKGRDGIDMYKFKIQVYDCVSEKMQEGLIHKKSNTIPNLTIGDRVGYSINSKGTIKTRKGFKPPKLEELYNKLFDDSYLEVNAHNGAADVNATARAFFEILRRQILSSENTDISSDHISSFLSKNNNPVQLSDIDLGPTSILEKTNNLLENDTNIQEVHSSASTQDISIFSHVRCHTSYSLLQSTISVSDLVSHVVSCGMDAVGITDHGNLFGAFEFVSLCQQNNIKPILGCSFYLVDDRKKHKFTMHNRDKRFSQVLYAKNKNGYKNLCKISSYGYIDGLYSGFPRIDKSLVKQYKSDLIATTSGIYGEIAQLIIAGNTKQAKESFLWWLNEFQDNFFIEVSRNDVKFENDVNKVLLEWAKEHNVKYLPTSSIYYINQSDAEAHDALLCVKNGTQLSVPKGQGYGKRFGFPNDNFYFKKQDEIISIFSDLPKSFESLNYFLAQFETYDLESNVLLPEYNLPDNFSTQNHYLRHLCEIGAKKKYGSIGGPLADRIDFELNTIEKTGYPGYFLIVQDIIKNAKKMGISVGPGRGSVGGSVVAYCLDITAVDPMAYELLFERFLNPDRVSMPDIDIDFDDVGRSKLINWVVEKYGKNQVAQIITYGKMAAKSSIRDMGRVLNVPLPQVDVLAKKIPNISLNEIFSLTSKELSSKLSRDDLNRVKNFIDSIKKNPTEDQLVKLACLTEGSIRNLGLHACGIIITPNDIANHVPVCTSSDSNLLITQFDNSVVERAGMLKMDFLGLNTLSQIKDAIFLIKKRHNLDLDIDNVDLKDLKTFALYQAGHTLGTFQFESPGMQKHLRALKPDKFEDLIAMNALYRPGPMEYIPNFIERKHGREAINYDLPVMEKYLGNTYGITVYQEQVMKLSQELAGFSAGKADVLRKAMGKKKKNILDGLKEEFFAGCLERKHDVKKVEKIWKDWEAFASYAFNKSHSTCYSFISFQTAYLKAHYPHEFMASLLTHHMNDLSKLTKYMDECKRMSISVLGPDLNESFIDYSVNLNNEIRFGLGAIKGVGSIAAESIINERLDHGIYINFIDFIKRVDSKVVNKRVLEALALGGVFDSLNSVNRANFFKKSHDQTFIELVIQFRSQFSKNNDIGNQLEMFDQATLTTMTKEPVLSDTEQWDRLELLNKEKEVLGIYISGHPLDEYSLEVNHFCSHQIRDIDFFNHPVNSFTFSGYVQSHIERMGKNDKPYGIVVLEDYSGKREFRLFGEEYIKFRNYFIVGALLYFSASIVRRSWDTTLNVKFNKINLLSDIAENLIKEINFRIHLDDISDIFVQDLVSVVQKHPGKHNLKLKISSHKVDLNFLSKSYQVQICQQFINEMSKFSNDFSLK